MIDQIRLRLADLEAGVSAPQESSGAPGASVRDTIATVGDVRARVPPGQHLVTTWPVLQVEPVPHPDISGWTLRVDGACDRPFELTFQEMQELGQTEVRADFHCVTGWSKLDNLWTGVPARHLLERAAPNSSATHVVGRADSGYTANVPISALLDDKALVAWGHNGADLAPEHGWPLRLVVPKLYGWKSVKWLRRLELLTADSRGFWEVRGYHNNADPWREERYSYQET
jgi:DMSO/TMAO reductase YedYZ molybdopterin-dependent catalytic subunit